MTQKGFTTSGFTLVELAIVLMIIGLLIGGVLRGQEMLQNARVTATIEQIKAYSAAYNTFKDVYYNLPGDMVLANTKIPGCNSGNHCQNGNGNGRLDNSTGETGGYKDQAWTPVDPQITSENAQFWKQLALAHLITGVDPSAATPAWGKSNPVSKINESGWFARYTDGGIAYDSAKAGTVIVLRHSISGNGYDCANYGYTEFCAISPKKASLIDRKMDDGFAATGNARAVSAVGWSHGCGAPNSGINGPSGYLETKDEPVCEMYFNVFD